MNLKFVLVVYYLDIDEDIKYWKKCYEKCETCNKYGNMTKMNCLSCKKNTLNISQDIHLEYINDIENNNNSFEDNNYFQEKNKVKKIKRKKNFSEEKSSSKKERKKSMLLRRCFNGTT